MFHKTYVTRSVSPSLDDQTLSKYFNYVFDWKSDDLMVFFPKNIERARKIGSTLEVLHSPNFSSPIVNIYNYYHLFIFSWQIYHVIENRLVFTTNTFFLQGFCAKLIRVNSLSNKHSLKQCETFNFNAAIMVNENDNTNRRKR